MQETGSPSWITVLAKERSNFMPKGYLSQHFQDLIFQKKLRPTHFLPSREKPWTGMLKNCLI